MTTTEPTVHAVQGWRQPPWASSHQTDGNSVTYTRHATVQPLVLSPHDGTTDAADIHLVRVDELVTSDDGDIGIQVGAVTLYLGEIEEMTVDQGPVLLAAVRELLDALDALGAGGSE